MLLPDSAAALASESFRTAFEYDIALDSPQMSASGDTRAFCGWAAEFRRQLATNRWTCAAMLTRDLTPCLSSLQLPGQVFAFLAECTPTQHRFLNALANAGVRVSATPVLTAEGSTVCPNLSEHENVSSSTPVRYDFDGVADELRAAAQWARQQVETSPHSRVGVLFFDLDRKLSQVENAFRSVLHPEHLLGQQTPSVFEIASPLSLSSYPVVRCVLQLLSLFAAPVDFHSFHAMLTSPYLAVAPESVARFVAEVRKNARREVSFEDLAQWLRESGEVPGVRSTLRAVLESIPKHAPFSSEQPVAYWADISRLILRAFGWPSGVPMDSGEFQCTESWRELLTSVSSLEMLGWRTDFRGFVARLERAAATQNFKPETLNAPVQIIDLAESEGSIFDALWIGSCSDDLWPDSPRHTPLIPLALLKEAGVAVEGTPQSEARLARITARLLQSAPRLSLSLARRADDEREQRWSPFFADFMAASEPINVPPPLAEQFHLVHLDMISDSRAPALGFGESARGGTSLLQDQSNCPFRAFAIRRLLAREEQGPNEPLAPTERGRIVDLALQRIWEQLQDSQGLYRPDLAAVIGHAVDEAMASELPSSDDPWTVRFRALERQRTIGVLTEWLEVEAGREPFHVVGHQLEVKVELGGLSLHGRLDRLDEIDGAHVVIDYKTGASNSVSAWRVPRPRMPQLPFYALAMKQQESNLAGVSFAIVRPGECGFKGYLREKNLVPCADSAKRSFDGLSFDEYTGRWADELEHIATAFAHGDAAVTPKVSPGKSGSLCEHCHLTSLCRIVELSGGDAESESEGEGDE